MISYLSSDLPSSLRPIQAFIMEAQKFATKVTYDETVSIVQCKRAFIASVNHALRFLSTINLHLDESGRLWLNEYIYLRNKLAFDVDIDLVSLPSLREYISTQVPLCGELLFLAEGDEALALAQSLDQEGFRTDATLNFQAACIYYRLLLSSSSISDTESVIREGVLSRLKLASWHAALGSSVAQNTSRVFFNGRSFSELYNIDSSRRLGKGSYGSVYLCQHRLTGDERAVKVMNTERVTSYVVRKMHTEMDILRRLDHPNIAKLHDVFFGRHSIYLVMNVCRGGELFQLLNSGKSQGFVFREDRASKLMHNMTSAVHYLHRNGIVHRDLKLENFLFDERSAAASLVLIDFGLSKLFEPGERMTHRVGSCYYIAPEVLRGNYDYRCDVWSLGVLCFMLLSGVPPFFGHNVEDVYSATLNNELVFPEKRFKGISATCIDFMRRLLVKDPYRRMTTAEALQHPFLDPSKGGSPCNRIFRNSSLTGRDFVYKVHRILDSMSIFIRADPLIKVTLLMIAHAMPPELVGEMTREFFIIDSDHSGSVSFAEFVEAFGACWRVRSGALDLAAAFAAICIECSHGRGQELTYHEYIASTMFGRVEIGLTRVSQVFASLDKDKLGVITRDSLRYALGGDVSVDVIDSIMQVGDPSIRPDTFMQHWKAFVTQHESRSRSFSTSFSSTSTGESFSSEIMHMDDWALQVQVPSPLRPVPHTSHAIAASSTAVSSPKMRYPPAPSYSHYRPAAQRLSLLQVHQASLAHLEVRTDNASPRLIAPPHRARSSSSNLTTTSSLPNSQSASPSRSGSGSVKTYIGSVRVVQRPPPPGASVGGADSLDTSTDYSIESSCAQIEDSGWISNVFELGAVIKPSDFTANEK